MKSTQRDEMENSSLKNSATRVKRNRKKEVAPKGFLKKKGRSAFLLFFSHFHFLQKGTLTTQLPEYIILKLIFWGVQCKNITGITSLHKNQTYKQVDMTIKGRCRPRLNAIIKQV